MLARRAAADLLSRKGSLHNGVAGVVVAVAAAAARSFMASALPLAKRALENKSDHSGISTRKKRKREKNIRAGGSSEDVLQADIRSLLRNDDVAVQELPTSLPELWKEVEVKIETLSSTGDGLGRTSVQPSRIFAVPFTAPGDLVAAKVVAHVQGPVSYTRADFVKVIEPSALRDDSLVRCRYFGECSGCQFQMLPYAYQLAHKKTIVEKAYRNFSGLSANLIPSVGETIGSPLQYGYRTKLTPHFDGPKNSRRLARQGQKARFDEVPPIGFHKKQMHRTLDIEECPISTNSIQEGLRRERERVRVELDKYSRGATLLLRESTKRIQRSEVPFGVDVPGYDTTSHTHYEYKEPHIYAKTCVTDPKSTFTEYIDDFRIRNIANSFFQNNNSILSTFVSYVRSHVIPASNSPLSTRRPKNLIDAYSGSGLFSVMLSSLFQHTVGIDIDSSAIAQARANARDNAQKNPTSSIPAYKAPPLIFPSDDSRGESELGSALDRKGEDSASAQGSSRPEHKQGIEGGKSDNKNEKRLSEPEFIAADASQLFASVKMLDPSETVVILDPPRKGCDESFLKQLLDFSPERIVYVSCNVHTQAADIGWLLGGGRSLTVETEDGTSISTLGKMQGSVANYPRDARETRYYFESLRGFDFFPQTGHVESVAVLSK